MRRCLRKREAWQLAVEQRHPARSGRHLFGTRYSAVVLIESIQKQEDLAGHRVTQIGSVCEAAVAFAVDDFLRGLGRKRKRLGMVGSVTTCSRSDRAAPVSPESNVWVTAKQIRPSALWFLPPSRR